MVDIWKSILWNVPLSLIVEGTTETVFQFLVLTKSSYSKTIASMNKNVFFEHHRKVKALNNLENNILNLIYVHFQSCPI